MNTGFHDPARFPFTRTLTESWEAMREEYLAVSDSMWGWVEEDLYDQDWDVFTIFDFPHGEGRADGISACPVTARTVSEALAHHGIQHGVVGFSRLGPGTHIYPHSGYQGDFLRCHLGLQVPSGDCRLTVARETRHWESGKVLVFDDRLEHEAWNNTDSSRGVLLIDFIPA